MQRLLRSRLGVVLAFGVLFLALDVGRSIWARVGLAHPSAEYRPDPALYADLTWPPGADVDPGAPLGARIFAQHCAVCHGPDGRGNGPAAPSMFPRPRDFSIGKFKYKSTAAGEPPTDEDLLRTIRDGLPASAMPYFAGLLSTEELNAVVEQVKSFSGAFSAPGGQVRSAYSAGSGRYSALGCAKPTRAQMERPTSSARKSTPKANTTPSRERKSHCIRRPFAPSNQTGFPA